MDMAESSSSESESDPEPPSSADFASVSEQSSSSRQTSSSKSGCKARNYKGHWKERYLVCQNEAYKVSTLTRHIDRKHRYSKHYSPSKKQRLISNFEKSLAKQQQTLKKALSPSELRKLASYKLAFTIARHKMPFSACEAFTSFARAADPESTVFKNMASSRNTIASRTVELHEKVLVPEITKKIMESPFWSIMADDSTDSAVQEQCGVYARFIDIEKEIVCTKFLSLERIVGHPDAENIYQGIMRVIGETGLNLPLQKLTCDGASVMISDKQGVLGKLRRNVNPKLFSIHCPPHRLVLASKTAQKEIPDFVEKLVSDTLFYFKDSAVRRDQFHSLMELTDPENDYISLVQYHRIRWLSLSDCVNRLCTLLPSLVRYFEEEMNDTKNRVAVQKKAKDLHDRLEKPLFAVYLYFLQPILDILADINCQLQRSNQSLYVTYCKIKAFRALLELLLVNPEGGVDDSNLTPAEECVINFYGNEFQKHVSQCEEHDLIPASQMSHAKKTMYAYLLAVGKVIDSRFPELEFMTTNLSFIDPPQRKLRQCNIAAIIEKFDNGENIKFCETTITKQYRKYCYDRTLDFLYEVSSNRNPVSFFIKLSGDEDYSELARIALLIYSLSPDSVACERGFSSMKYVKNQYRTRLTQEKLHGFGNGNKNSG